MMEYKEPGMGPREKKVSAGAEMGPREKKDGRYGVRVLSSCRGGCGSVNDHTAVWGGEEGRREGVIDTLKEKSVHVLS